MDRPIPLAGDDDGPSALERYTLLAESAANKLSDPGGHNGDDSKSQKEPNMPLRPSVSVGGSWNCIMLPIWPECYALAAITRLGPATRPDPLSPVIVRHSLRHSEEIAIRHSGA